MSYGIMPYRVNLSRLRSRFEKDHPPKKKSKAASACLRRLNRYNDFSEDSKYPNSELIKDFFAEGKAKHQHLGHKYWYALEGLIQELGSYLPNDQWYPSDCDPFYSIKGFTMYDLGDGLNVPSPDDFPAVFTLKNQDMTDELIVDFTKSHESDFGDDAIKQFVGWIKQAKRYNQDLVLYYY